MRTLAAICLSTCIGLFSFIIPTTQEHAWKSSHHSVRRIPSAPRADLLTAQNLAPLSASVAAESAPATVPTTSPPPAPPAVTPLEYAEWTKVAVCEEGGWIGYAGPAYPDSLGISATNWYGNGGGSDVSPDAQILVAERIQTSPPDQDGCAAW